MRVLDVFSGTHSVGKVCDELGWAYTSLDVDGNADINCDVMVWDYTELAPDSFDVVWCSPPCNTFSKIRNSWIGRVYPKQFNGQKITKALLYEDIREKGLPLLEKVLDIIFYFQPKYYFIENPSTSKMKEYLKLPYFEVDYCMYSDWGYQKRTRIWSNLSGFNNKLCDRQCGNMSTEGNGRSHRVHIGVNFRGTLQDKYRVPHQLILDMFTTLRSISTLKTINHIHVN